MFIEDLGLVLHWRSKVNQELIIDTREIYHFFGSLFKI